jgi:uncharacterized protein
MKTYSGRILDVFNLQLEDIDIVDIAHHLSLECRFNGATPFHYSVAQHSVLCAREDTICQSAFESDIEVGVCHAKHKLLHDASEAYLRDIPRPVKHTEMFAPYRELEHKIQNKIFFKFGLSLQMPKCTKEADDRLLVREGIELMNERYKLGNPSCQEICAWSPAKSESEFLYMFRQLFLSKVDYVTK